MSKRYSQYIASSDYFDKSLIVLFVTNGGISIAPFATVVRAPVGIASASKFFQFFTGTVKKLLRTTRNHNKVVMLTRSKLNSLESKISEALINNEISHEDFMTVISEERKHRELNESIRMMNSQRSGLKKII